MDPHSSFLLNWRSVVVVVIVYYATLVFYRLFLDPLARFPGPRLAAISRWYEAYYDVIRGGQYTAKIAELHKIYGSVFLITLFPSLQPHTSDSRSWTGPIIRISPYELHVIDPAFFETLYRMGGRWDKYAWAYDAFGAKRSTIFGAGRHCLYHYYNETRVKDLLACFNRPRCTPGTSSRYSTFFFEVKSCFSARADLLELEQALPAHIQARRNTL